ncbi:Hypothetical predicted protein [Marmota monax]|uniref:Neugrin n=1 Tax=Marmota monax TaxID=9995 RepID=A0A5E4B655_MARMO|nr:hypothetical protein GHT09_011511 [Marmota monax]VTJ64202.1 Hypothetical predicted protein [Marmota monax]
MAVTLSLLLGGRVSTAVAAMGSPPEGWRAQALWIPGSDRIPTGSQRSGSCGRVLKSKFVPTLEQKLKQDQKVLKKAEFAHSLPQLQGSRDTVKPLAAGHSVSNSLLMPGDEVSSEGQHHSTALTVIESKTHSTNALRQKGRNKGIQGLKKESFVPITAALGHQRELQKYSNDCVGTRRTDSNGLPSDEKLEMLKTGELQNQNFSSKVVQRGWEFFDSNGNFLYRI